MTTLLAILALLAAGLFLIGWGMAKPKKPTFTKKEMDKWE